MGPFRSHGYPCDQAQLEHAQASEAEVPGMADAAADAAIADPEGFTVTWFGDASYADAVSSNYSAISGAAGGIEFRCENCGAVAHVYKNRPGIIWLCPSFFSGGWGGDVILHEISHWNSTAGANDNTYGCGNAQSLAQNDPYGAFTNADNYRCAAM